jgi:phage anti-repressor protein
MISLQDYLKKYSTINNTFIDDFFGLYDVETSTNDFVINLETIVKWLKTTKAHMKDTLVTSYIKNIDYKISKGSSTGGRPSEIIVLTPECFKRLAMLSKTKKAEEVRTYFIQLEKHIDKYKNYIIEALNKKVNIMKNNQKPIVDNREGTVYVLKTDLDIENLYRIGKTKSFKTRMSVHNSTHFNNVEIAFIYDTKNIDEVEACLKALLKSKQYRKRKEFYEVDIDIIKDLLENCEKLSLKAKNKNIDKKLDKTILVLNKK